MRLLRSPTRPGPGLELKKRHPRFHTACTYRGLDKDRINKHARAWHELTMATKTNPVLDLAVDVTGRLATIAGAISRSRDDQFCGALSAALSVINQQLKDVKSPSPTLGRRICTLLGNLERLCKVRRQTAGFGPNQQLGGLQGAVPPRCREGNTKNLILSCTAAAVCFRLAAVPRPDTAPPRQSQTGSRWREQAGARSESCGPEETTRSPAVSADLQCVDHCQSRRAGSSNTEHDIGD